MLGSSCADGEQHDVLLVCPGDLRIQEFRNAGGLCRALVCEFRTVVVYSLPSSLACHVALRFLPAFLSQQVPVLQHGLSSVNGKAGSSYTTVLVT